MMKMQHEYEAAVAVAEATSAALKAMAGGGGGILVGLEDVSDCAITMLEYWYDTMKMGRLNAELMRSLAPSGRLASSDEGGTVRLAGAVDSEGAGGGGDGGGRGPVLAGLEDDSDFTIKSPMLEYRLNMARLHAKLTLLRSVTMMMPPLDAKHTPSLAAPGGPTEAGQPTVAEMQRVHDAAVAAAKATRAAMEKAAGGGGGGRGRGPLAAVFEWADELVLRGHRSPVHSLALLPGGRFSSGDAEGTVRLWNTARGGKATSVLEVRGGMVYALAALPDGRRLAAGVRTDRAEKAGAIVVWDTGVMPPTLSATVDCGSGVWVLAVLRDGRLAAGCHDGGVRLVEVGAGAGAVTATLKRHTNVVIALAVLPDGTLASGSWDSTVRLWDVGARACVATLAGHSGEVFALAVLADGRLASGSDDKTVRLWDVATRASVAVLEGHTGRVSALAALPDGRLVIGSCDAAIRVWDTRRVPATGGAGTAAAAGGGAARATPVVAVERYDHFVHVLAPLPDGRLASGSGDKSVRLWRLPPL